MKGKCDWLQQWMDLAKRFAFQYNPALQPRAIVVYGCISKTISEAEIKQLLRILRKALESESILIEGVVMCLTRVQPLLKQVSLSLDAIIHCISVVLCTFVILMSIQCMLYKNIIGLIMSRRTCTGSLALHYIVILTAILPN